MKEINEENFKSRYLLFYDNYKKGNYILSVYIDEDYNKFINVLDLDLMENTYYIEESSYNSNTKYKKGRTKNEYNN